MTDEKLPISEFTKLDLKVGEILEVEDHPNADKLYVLTVDLGEETTRKIVAGLRPYYQKDELEGQRAIFIANLEPATLRGVESNGMILAASSEDKSSVVILKPEKNISIGSKVS